MLAIAVSATSAAAWLLVEAGDGRKEENEDLDSEKTEISRNTPPRSQSRF